MAVYTKPGAEVFAPTDNAGNPRSVDNGDAQVWATEVERDIIASKAGMVVFELLSELNGTPGTRAGQPGRVTTGEDKGEYSWSGSAWVRVGDIIDADALQSNIDAEALVRSGADAALQTNIEAEALARTNADSALQGDINLINTASRRGFLIPLEVSSYADNNYKVTVNEDFAHVSQIAGTLFIFRAVGGTNTGPVTINIGEQEARPVLNIDSLPLAPGEMLGLRWYILRHAGADFRIVAMAPPARTNAFGLLKLASPAEMLSGTGEGAAVPATTIPLVRPLADAHILETAYPLPSEVDGAVYPLVTNEAGRVLLGINMQTGDIVGGGIGSAGGTVSVASESPLVPYLDNDDLHAVGLDDQVVANLAGYTASAVAPGNGGHVSAIIDKPMLGATSVVGAGPAKPGLLVPANAKALYCFIGVGQSLMVGSTAATTLVSITPVLPDEVLMLNAGAAADVRLGLPTAGSSEDDVDPADLTGFIPLVAKRGSGGTDNRGETPMEAFATNLSLLAREIDVQFRSVSFTATRGGTVYANLKKGTQIYDNTLIALARAKELAEAQGWRLVVAGVLHKHGEGDRGNPAYYDHLIEWQNDIDTDFKAITGQTLDVMFFMGQPSTHQGEPLSGQAMVDAHNNSPYHWLTGPDYPFGEFYSDETHLHGPGYFLVGEQMALAYRDLMWGAGYAITQMTAAERTGTTVKLTWDVPHPPLAFDTTLFTERDVMGLRYRDGSSDIAITSATITNDGTGTNVGEITLTLGSAPDGLNPEFVWYAYSNKEMEPLNRARGNIRDSRPDVSRLDGRPLHGWAPHHRIAVDVV